MAREFLARFLWIDRFKKARALVSAAAVLLVVAGLSLGGYVACQSPSYEDPCKGAAMQNPTEEYARQVMEDNTLLLFRQPNFDGSGVRYFEGSDARYSPSRPGAEGKWGILIEVTGGKIDQSTLPDEDRIPDCLDGVPIRWEEDVEPSQLGGGDE